MIRFTNKKNQGLNQKINLQIKKSIGFLKEIPKKDLQFIFIFLICAIFFIATDILFVFEKINLAYWSGHLINEPYRIISNHFIHGDVQHLLTNIFGIVFARYCLQALGLKNNFFFILLVVLLIPSQTLLLWLTDIFFFKNFMSLAIGFSGILYGVNAFTLLASKYGKRKYFGLYINLKENTQIHNMVLIFNIIGIILSILPGISLKGHLSGFFAGLLLFIF